MQGSVPVLSILRACTAASVTLAQMVYGVPTNPIQISNTMVSSAAKSKLRILSNAGIAASVTLAQVVYGVPANVILDSAARAVSTWDVATSMIKAWVFGVIISVVRSVRSPASCHVLLCALL